MANARQRKPKSVGDRGLVTRAVTGRGATQARGSLSSLDEVPIPDGEFARTYLVWRNEPFPYGSSTDSVDELHAELAYVDDLVADDVIPMAKERTSRPGTVNVVEALSALDAKVEALHASVGPGDRELLDAYRRYSRLMRDVYVVATTAIA